MLPKSPEEFHQKISLIFHALLAIPLTCFIYLLLELKHNEPKPILNNELFMVFATYLMPILGLGILLLGYLRFRKNLAQMSKDQGLKHIMGEYGKVVREFYYYFTFSSIVLVSGLYLTTEAIFIVSYVLVLFFLSLQRPTPEKYVKDMALKDEFKDIILHKKEFGDQ